MPHLHAVNAGDDVIHAQHICFVARPRNLPNQHPALVGRHTIGRAQGRRLHVLPGDVEGREAGVAPVGGDVFDKMQQHVVGDDVPNAFTGGLHAQNM